MKAILSALILGAFGAGAWFALSFWIRLRRTPKIPPDLVFEHELRSREKLRAIAEALPSKFRAPKGHGVVCLGVVRGNAARVLFHAGPTEPRGSLYRLDYVLFVERVSKQRVRLRLGTNAPYSYFKIRRSELAPLVGALRESFGDIVEM